MDLGQLLSNLSTSTSTFTSSPVLRALWLDYNSEWDKAHEAIHNEHGEMAAAVHAYLHRKEGDIWNANYWYRNAHRKPFQGSLEDEWHPLVQEECANPGLLKRSA